MDPIYYLCFVFVCHTVLSLSLLPDLGFLVCDVFLRFGHFSMWFPGLGVVLYCIDS